MLLESIAPGLFTLALSKNLGLLLGIGSTSVRSLRVGVTSNYEQFQRMVSLTARRKRTDSKVYTIAGIVNDSAIEGKAGRSAKGELRTEGF